jgi:hypothetical protein
MALREKDIELLKPVDANNHDNEIAILGMWLGLLLVATVTGVLMTYFSIATLKTNWPATSEPLEVRLYDLENGIVPSNPHLKIGEHIAMYSVRIDGTYPIFSMEETEIADYVDTTPGAEFEWQTNQLLYRLRKCKILVRNPGPASGIFFEGSVEGMIVGRASDLDFGEVRFSKLNIRNPDEVFVLEVGRKPNIWPGIGLLIGGLLCLVVAAFAVSPILKVMKHISE